MSWSGYGAVAVDLGASSGRYAVGRLVDDRISMEVVRKIAHEPLQQAELAVWDLDSLMALAREAAAYASEQFDRATLGIDSWGVDCGFLDHDGKLLAPPVAYRDLSHVRQHDRMAEHRARLYALTGIQHMPFNTVYQLAARREEHPDWPASARWFILPDLMIHLLGGRLGHELSQASTTQLLGLDDQWSQEALALVGWPVPELQPELPGKVAGRVADGVEIVRVASHDTASAVCGLGDLRPTDVFLNMGTWSLLGCVLDSPLVGDKPGDDLWTNERMHDGRVRLLRNIPGFYCVNRVHQELGISQSVGQWLAQADPKCELRFDFFHDDLFNPPSMVEAVCGLLGRTPANEAQWAQAVLGSLIEATVPQPELLGKRVGRRFERIRVAGGGSQSEAFCQALATGTGLPVVAGPVEATLLGNLAMQMVGAGLVSLAEVGALVERSFVVRTYQP